MEEGSRAVVPDTVSRGSDDSTGSTLSTGAMPNYQKSVVFHNLRYSKDTQRQPESILEDTKHCIVFQLSQVVFTLSFVAFPAQVISSVVSFPHNCLATAHANDHCYRASSRRAATARTMASVCQHSVYQHRLERVQDEAHTQNQHGQTEDNNN